MRHPRIWFVIADGGRARIVEPREERSQFRTQREIESVDLHHRSHDIGSDRPGRSQESAASGGHAVEPREDIHEAAKRGFAQEVADILNSGAERDEFDQLVLVAPAKILNEIRGHLDAATAPRVIGELQRDLTKVPDAELKDHLAPLALA